MTLQTSARKLAAIAVTGAVVVIGGSAFADELMPADPVVVEEGEETVVEEPVIEKTAVEETVVEDPAVLETVEEETDVDESDVEETVVDEVVELEAIEETEDTTAEDTTLEATHPANHGAAVSEAAHAPTSEGARNHGEAVSAVARSDAGKPEGSDHGRGHKADR